MRIIATVTYYRETGQIYEHRQAQVDFDAEFELPGAESDPAKAISGRGIEIQTVTESLFAGMLAEGEENL